MPQPAPYSQIDSSDLAGTPVLSLLAERGLEFRRVSFRIRQLFALFFTLFVLASVVSVLLISALENSLPPTASISAYVICGAFALIASVWILISNRNLRVIVTNDGVTVRSTSVKWDQIVDVRRGWFFHSSVFVDKAAPIEISNWIQGGDFVLDLCEWAMDHKLELAAIAGADLTSNTEYSPRLRFPIRHRLTKTLMTGIGMSHITLNTLMDAVLEFGHATWVREN